MKVISTIHLSCAPDLELLEFPANARSIALLSGNSIQLWPNGLKMRELIDDRDDFGATALILPDNSEESVPQKNVIQQLDMISEVFPSGPVTASHKFGQVLEIPEINTGLVTYTHQVNLESSIASSDVTVVEGGDIMRDGIVVGTILNVIVPTGIESKLGTFDYRALAIGHALEIFGETINET
jgi:hypothetical protein